MTEHVTAVHTTQQPMCRPRTLHRPENSHMTCLCGPATEQISVPKTQQQDLPCVTPCLHTVCACLFNSNNCAPNSTTNVPRHPTLKAASIPHLTRTLCCIRAVQNPTAAQIPLTHNGPLTHDNHIHRAPQCQVASFLTVNLGKPVSTCLSSEKKHC